ncbi:MAG: hypothetical protein K9M15_00775 [Candidatus Marinimicrobia bacterium]|nr:hypothetical protein [Candidatus Neomarinimicrobiota bacterium]
MSNRFRVFLLFIVLVFPAFIFAQTREEISLEIQRLYEQIEFLESQLVAIQSSEVQNTVADQEVASGDYCPNITHNLYFGISDNSSGGDVTRLQKYLAQDSSVYPESIISGYYGILTEVAVKKWQCKHDVVCSGTASSMGYGVFGPSSRNKLNELCGVTSTSYQEEPESAQRSSSSESATSSVGTTRAATLSEFWAGKAYLGESEYIPFSGTPSGGISANYLEGGVAYVDNGNGKIYAYFRQGKEVTSGVNSYAMFMAISQDKGKTFQAVGNPVVGYDKVASLGYVSVLDSDVVKRSDGYYMVSEIARSSDCGPSSAIFYSKDGVNNWESKGVLACVPLSNWGSNTMGSASVPNIVETPSGQWYLQWSNLFGADRIVTKHQAKFDMSNVFKRITNNTNIGQLTHPSAGSWNDRNYDTGDVIYENGYYYMFYIGARHFTLQGENGFGLARTANVNDVNSWEQFNKNPFLTGVRSNNASLLDFRHYPEIIKIDGAYYLYYNYFCGKERRQNGQCELGNYNAKVFRQKILFNGSTIPSKPTCSLTATPSSINSGGSSTLSWSASNATSATLSGISSVNPSSGSKVVSPTVTTTYTLNVSGAGGLNSCSATVTVSPTVNTKPTCSLTATPSSISSGGTSTLVLTTSNVTSVSLTPYMYIVSGSLTASGGTMVVDPDSTINYTINVSGPNGSGSCSATVTVSSVCQPNCSCAANTCVGSTCTNSCGTGTCSGTKVCTVAQSVSSFSLVNADTEKIISTLSSGATINIATTKNLNIIANTNPATVGSVKLYLDGVYKRTENGAPYSFPGDVSGDYLSWTPTVGTHTIKAVPYTGSNGTGTAGTAKEVSFNVVNNPKSAYIISTNRSLYMSTSQMANVLELAKDLLNKTLQLLNKN